MDKVEEPIILSFKFTSLVPPDTVVGMDGYSKRRKRFLLYNYIVTFLRDFHKELLSVSRTTTNSICKRLQKKNCKGLSFTFAFLVYSYSRIFSRRKRDRLHTITFVLRSAI